MPALSAESGPLYPQFAKLAKWRRLATEAGGVRFLSTEDRDGYFAALSREVSALNKPKADGYGPGASRCASGSRANTAAGIFAACSARQAREWESALRRDKDRRLKECDWAAEYAEAMEAKRAAIISAASNEVEKIIAPVFEPWRILPAYIDAAANDNAQAKPKRARKPRQLKRAAPLAPVSLVAAVHARFMERRAWLQSAHG